MQALKKAEKSRQAETSSGPEQLTLAADKPSLDINSTPSHELTLNPAPASKTVALTDFPSLALSEEPSAPSSDADSSQSQPMLELRPATQTEKIEPSLDLALAPILADNALSLEPQTLELSLESTAPPSSLATPDNASNGLANRLGRGKTAPTAPAQIEPELGLSLEDEFGLPLNGGNKPAAEPTRSNPPAPPEFAPLPPLPSPAASSAPAAETEPAPRDSNPPPRSNRPMTGAFTTQAEQDAKQQAAGQHKAKAVFGAKQANMQRKNILYLMLGLSCFSVLGAYFFYQTQINQSGVLVVPSAPPAPVNVLNAAGHNPTAPSANEIAPNNTSKLLPASPPDTPNPQAKAASSKPASENAATPAASNSGTATKSATNISPNNGPNSVATDTPPASKPVAKASQRSDNNASNIKLMRSESQLQLHPSLQQAYRAYQQGDDGQAMQAYKKVLQQEPRNRDAMLGLAPVALRQGDQQEAVSQYLQLLEADPNDPDASAALIGLQMADPTQSESRLKKILQQHPQSASLHFMLGNVYARQERWSDAQQSYFRAYTAAPNNADYMFNLAVSLDRLGQAKLALEYYQRALVQGPNNNFDSAATQNRVRQLQDQLGSGN